MKDALYISFIVAGFIFGYAVVSPLAIKLAPYVFSFWGI